MLGGNILQGILDELRPRPISGEFHKIIKPFLEFLGSFDVGDGCELFGGFLRWHRFKAPVSVGQIFQRILSETNRGNLSPYSPYKMDYSKITGSIQLTPGVTEANIVLSDPKSPRSPAMPQTLVFAIHLYFDPATTAVALSILLAVAAYLVLQAFDQGVPQ